MSTLDAAPWMRRVRGFEPSGICRIPGEEALYVVGDEGQLARVDIDSRPEPEVLMVRPGTDLEGVAVTRDGRILMLAEQKNQVWEVRDGRRIQAWKIRPKAKKNRGYEGMTIAPGRTDRLLLSIQGSAKGSELRSFAIPDVEKKSLELLHEQTLPWPDVAGLTWYDGTLLALSDRGRTLAALLPDGPGWAIARTWKTPADDLEGVAVLDGFLYLAQDSGGLWRGPWPQDPA